MHDQDRAWGRVQHSLRHAAKQQSRDVGSPTYADHDELGRHFACGFDDSHRGSAPSDEAIAADSESREARSQPLSSLVLEFFDDVQGERRKDADRDRWRTEGDGGVGAAAARCLDSVD
jgi:hypothetical protein